MLYAEGLIVVGGVITLFLFIVGCCILLEDKKASIHDTTIEEDLVKEPFTLMLDWYPNAMHAFLYAAFAKGFFADEGLEVTIKFPTQGEDPLNNVLDKTVDASMYYMADTILAAVNDAAPVVSIGAIVQGDLNVVISLQEQGITGPEHLVGKKIGYCGDLVSPELIRFMLDSMRVNYSKCQFIDVGLDLLKALTGRRVDATIGNCVNHEVPMFEDSKIPINYFYPIDFGCPNQHELVFISHKDNVTANYEKYQKFLNACKNGYEYVRKNKTECLLLILDNQNKEFFPLSSIVEEESLEMLIPTMELVRDTFLQQERRIWQDTTDWLRKRGYIKKDIDISPLVVDFFKTEPTPEDVRNGTIPPEYEIGLNIPIGNDVNNVIRNVNAKSNKNHGDDAPAGVTPHSRDTQKDLLPSLDDFDEPSAIDLDALSPINIEPLSTDVS